MRQTATDDKTYWDDPLADWANDDLMLSAATRDKLAAQYPQIIAVLDWPALREKFAVLDKQANDARDETRNNGLYAVGFGTAALILAALTPLLSVDTATTGWVERAPPILATLGTIGFSIASWLKAMRPAFRNSDRARWLERRFLSERLRQLHFQFVAAHPDHALRAMTDTAARAE